MAFNLQAARQQAAIRRRILVAALGGVCMECGSTDNLEFHHTEPREWVAAELYESVPF